MVGKSTIGLEKTQFIKLSGRIFTKKNLRPLQNKKGQKNLGYPRKKQSFSLIKGLLFSRVPQIFLALLILKRL